MEMCEVYMDLFCTKGIWVILMEIICPLKIKRHIMEILCHI
jgi:hypothetical protein